MQPAEDRLPRGVSSDPLQALQAAVAAHQAKLQTLEGKVGELGERTPEDRISLVVFSGDLDRQLAAFVIATGAAASGMQVSMFFTFWGTSALRRPAQVKKDFWGRMFGVMLPKGTRKLNMSQMNMAGAGPVLMRHLMKRKGVASLEELVELAGDLGVRLDVCTMSMDLMGLQKEEIIEYPDLGYCGVATFVEMAAKSKATLFI